MRNYNPYRVYWISAVVAVVACAVAILLWTWAVDRVFDIIDAPGPPVGLTADVLADSSAALADSIRALLDSLAPGEPVETRGPASKETLVASFVAAATAVPDTVPPLIFLASWLAQYEVFVVFEQPTVFEALAPTTGSPVDRYHWQFELVTNGYNLPPEYLEGWRVSASMTFGSAVDSVRARVWGVDTSEVAGPPSEWSIWYPWP